MDFINDIFPDCIKTFGLKLCLLLFVFVGIAFVVKNINELSKK